ncbi:hypothetical protein BC826DRAFT_1028299 [Russula brevipes]|nr:hypothetical protein BC826DRAFT_1028299 [Russula brevipes]
MYASAAVDVWMYKLAPGWKDTFYQGLQLRILSVRTMMLWQLLRLAILGLPLVHHKSLIFIVASPVSTAARPSAASTFTGRAKASLPAVSIANTGQPVTENREVTEPVAGGTISQQKQRHQPADDKAPCSMLMVNDGQPDEPSSTVDAKSSTTSSQVKPETTLGTKASVTTAHEPSRFVVSVPSEIRSILGEIAVEPTSSTFSVIPGGIRGKPSISPVGNPASLYQVTTPPPPPHPTSMTTAKIECRPQKGSAGSNMQRYARGRSDDKSCDDPDEPPPQRNPGSTSVTADPTSEDGGDSAASSSGGLASMPPLPPLLQWLQCMTIVFIVARAVIYRFLCYIRRSLELCDRESNAVPCDGVAAEQIADGGKCAPGPSSESGGMWLMMRRMLRFLPKEKEIRCYH